MIQTFITEDGPLRLQADILELEIIHYNKNPLADSSVNLVSVVLNMN